MQKQVLACWVGMGLSMQGWAQIALAVSPVTIPSAERVPNCWGHRLLGTGGLPWLSCQRVVDR